MFDEEKEKERERERERETHTHTHGERERKTEIIGVNRVAEKRRMDGWTGGKGYVVKMMYS